ncbi:MAG: hypothetical protein LC437_05265 [Thiohalomonas sp.]|nr:hypothetical protein [Thiohalomonas sp.]
MCPVGAFYSLLGTKSLLRVSAAKRDDSNACYVVCPEPKVIIPALKGADKDIAPLIDDGNCGRCIDVCDEDVFNFSSRFKS